MTSTMSPRKMVRILNPIRRHCRDCGKSQLERLHITYTENRDGTIYYWDYIDGQCGHTLKENSH